MALLFLEHFRSVPDHRVPGLVTYPLDELLLSTLSGLLCGAEDWEDVVTLAEAHLAWLRGYLPFRHGIASADTYQTVFRALDSDALAASFMTWVSSLIGHLQGVIAIDGKTLRGSKHEAGGKGALHLLSAFAHEAGLVIGQRRVDGKSNEITAIPELLAVLALEGAIVTIDAMGAQRDIAEAICAHGADYVLALKGNQSTLHADVRLFTGAFVTALFNWRNIRYASIREEEPHSKMGYVHLFDEMKTPVRSERITPQTMSQMIALIDGDGE